MNTEIQKLRERRAVLGSTIRSVVADQLGDFWRQTGLSVSAIDISFVETTQIGAGDRSYEIADVTVMVSV